MTGIIIKLNNGNELYIRTDNNHDLDWVIDDLLHQLARNREHVKALNNLGEDTLTTRRLNYGSNYFYLNNKTIRLNLELKREASIYQTTIHREKILTISIQAILYNQNDESQIEAIRNNILFDLTPPVKSNRLAIFDYVRLAEMTYRYNGDFRTTNGYWVKDYKIAESNEFYLNMAKLYDKDTDNKTRYLEFYISNRPIG